jgi:diguanylate cyclase (GGDEF)-like protein
MFAVLAFSSYVGLSSYSSFQAKSFDITQKLVIASDLQLLIERMLMPPNDYLITGDNAERRNFAALTIDAARIFEKIKKRGVADDNGALAIEREVERGIIEMEQMGMNILSIDNPVGNREAARLMEEFDAFGAKLVEKVDGLHAGMLVEVEGHRDASARIDSIVRLGFFVLSVSVLAGLLVIIYLVRKTVVVQISKLTDAVTLVGSGNFDRQIDIKTGDELETLGSEFNRMSMALKHKMTEVSDYSVKLETTNRRLNQNILQLYTIYNISKTLSASVATEQLLVHIVKEVESSLKIHRINIMLVNEERTELHLAAGLGISDEAMNLKLKLDSDIYGMAVRTGHAEILCELSSNPRFTPTAGLDDNVSSMIIAPFRGRGEVIGLLNACKVEGDGFDNDAFELIVATANQIGMTLENARLLEKMRMQANTDGMTSLYNFRYFSDMLRQEFDRAKRYKRSLSLIMMDVDFFKKYNDAHGHPRGDEVLRGVASIIKNNARALDTVARYGGEEFVVILPETGEDMALVAAERFRKSVEEASFYGAETQPSGRVTISLGVASIGNSVKDADTLVRNADTALYCAKKDGRNRVRSISPDEAEPA